MPGQEQRQDFRGRPVASLQYMLGRMARVYPFLPPLAVDGVFGRETQRAVLRLQEQLLPPATGVVDEKTFAAIRKLWQEAEQLLADTRPLRVLPSGGYRAEPGENRNFLILPQTMFRVLEPFFSGIQSGRTDGDHSGTSVDNVRWLQRAGGLEETGILDRYSWDLLCRLYEAVVVWAPELSQRPEQQGWG